MNLIYDNPKYQISIIVLAAGQSSRMGATNKLLLPFRSKTVLETVLDEICKISTLEIILVVGHERSKIEKIAAPYSITIAYNEQYPSGMTSSIQTGIRAASPDSKGYMICLADMPLIQKDEYEALLDVFHPQESTEAPQIIIPEYQGTQGQPKIFSHHFKADILTHQAPNGCKEIINSNSAHHHIVTMPHDHILMDMDSPEAYRAMLARVE